MNVVLIGGTIFAAIFLGIRAKLKANGEWEARRQRRIYNRFTFYNNNIFVRGKFRRIVQNFSTLNCSKLEKVREDSVKLFEKACLSMIVIVVLGAIGFQDILLVCLTALIGSIYYDVTVEKHIDKIYRKVIEEVSQCIQTVRAKYKETGSIKLAVLNSDKGKYLEAPVNEIYEMLISTESEEKLYQLCRKTPVRLLKTLAMVCYIVNERGDTKDERGSSVFADELTSLRQEADMEIRRLEKVRIAFKSLAIVALVGIIGTPIADWFLMSKIPGTATLIRGVYGLTEKTIIIGVTILAYYLISVYNKPTVVNVVDKIQWIDSLSKNRRVQKFVANIIPKKFSTRRKIKKMKQGAMSSKSLEYIYTSKVVFSAIAFVATLVLLCGFTLAAKMSIWNSTKPMGFLSSRPDLSGKAMERLASIDDWYMNQPEKPLETDAISFVESRVPELRTLEVQNEVDRLSMKWDKYHDTRLRVWYIFVAYAAAVAGWFVPEISLMFRKRLVQFEDIEDVMQLQNLMITLSQTTMSVYEVLYWLEKQATVNKAPISYAIQSYYENPIETLEELKMSVNSPDLKRLVMKLQSAVRTLPMQEAFSDTILDKEQLRSMREMAQIEVIESKKENAKLFASAPAAIMLLGGIVAPIIILGFSEILKTFNTL